MFRDENAVREYSKAVERYAADGDRARMMEALLGMGIDADRIRWHLTNPGRVIAAAIYD